MNKEYDVIVKAINRIKNEDDVHDYACKITQLIHEVGQSFEFDEDADKSIEIEMKLTKMLFKRCKEVSSPEFYRMYFGKNT